MVNNKLKKVRLKGNHSFNLREGWLRKGMKAIEQYADLFSREDATQILGVGTKMVAAIKYWLISTGLAEEQISKNKHNLVITKYFGQIVYEFDPYFEDVFTLYLLHYNLVSNIEYAVAWYLFFNNFDAISFTRENVLDVLKIELEKIMEQGCSFSESLLKDDCNSILKMYLNDGAEENPDDNLSSPFANLGLLKKSRTNSRNFEKATPKFNSIDPLLILYMIIKKAEDNHVSVSGLLNEVNSPGKVLNLTRPMLEEYLDRLRLKGYITINTTAGLDTIYLNTEMSAEDILKKYYQQD